jgi:hypothetical protein
MWHNSPMAQFDKFLSQFVKTEQKNNAILEWKLLLLIDFSSKQLLNKL